MLLLLPYLLIRWLRSSGFKIERLESRIIGVMAGIAFCLDPLYLTVFFALELFYRFDKTYAKPFVAPELKCVLLTLGVYLGHFLFLPFSAFNYFTCIVPLNIVDYITWDDRMEFLNAISEMDWSRWTSPDRRDIIYWSFSISTVALALRRRISLLSPLAVLCLIGALTYVVQGKALSCQALIMVISSATVGLMVVCAVVGVVVERISKRKVVCKERGLISWGQPNALVTQTVVILCLVGFVAVCKTSWKMSGKTIKLSEFGSSYIGTADRADLSQFAVKVMERTKPGDRVIILNDNVKAAYPLLLQINRVPASSIMWGFPFRLFSVAAQEESWLYTVFLQGREASLYEQLGQEIERANAKCILIQSGRTLDYLQNRDIIDKVKAHYKLDGDLTWHDAADRDVDASNLELWGGWEATQMYVVRGKK